MVEQLLTLKNVTKINEFVKVFQENVETDLTFQNILWFAQQAVFGGLTIDNVEFVTMPNRNTSAWSRTYRNHQSYVTPIASELLELVNTKLSPYTEVFTLSDLDIMSVNSDGSVSSSTGHVEDSKAAQPPVISKPSQPTEPAEETPQETPEEGGTGGTIVVDPETGEPVTGGETADPGTGGETADPGAGGETADPGTGGTATDPGAADPGAGGTAEDPGTTTPETQPSGGETTDPGTGGGETAPAPDEGFVIVS